MNSGHMCCAVRKAFFEKAVTGVTFVGSSEPTFQDFVIDSRKVHEGSTFVALKGASVDGHDFIGDAVARGARGIIMSSARRDALNQFKPAQLSQLSIALVADPETAFTTLATAWRNQFSIPVIGVTGTVGKTSTKELIAAMVRAAGRSCLVSEGNYNTHLGVSITLLKLRPEHQCVVMEMGISHRGEMAQLADIVQPTMGVITCIGHQHMDGLGSLADIAAEKRQIFKNFKPDNIGFIFGDQPILSAISYAHPIVKFGYKTTNNVQMRRVVMSGTKATGVLKFYGERFDVTLSAPHKGLVLNALASAAVAYFLEIPPACIVATIEAQPPVPGRFQSLPIRAGKGCIIDDAYNANPESMKEALMAFEQLETRGKKIAILGDMLGLGVTSTFWHRQVGRFLRKTPSIQQVVLVGNHMVAAQKTAPRFMQISSVATWEEALAEVNKLTSDSEVTLLCKASNGVGLQNIARALTRE